MILLWHLLFINLILKLGDFNYEPFPVIVVLHLLHFFYYCFTTTVHCCCLCCHTYYCHFLLLHLLRSTTIAPATTAPTVLCCCYCCHCFCYATSTHVIVACTLLSRRDYHNLTNFITVIITVNHISLSSIMSIRQSASFTIQHQCHRYARLLPHQTCYYHCTHCPTITAISRLLLYRGLSHITLNSFTSKPIQILN